MLSPGTVSEGDWIVGHLLGVKKFLDIGKSTHLVTKTTKNEVNIESRPEKQECSSTGRKTKLSNGEAKEI